MICPRPPITDHPELRHGWWQDIGSYAVRWVWEPGATAWRCDRIMVRSSLQDRSLAHDAAERAITTQDLQRGEQLCREKGWT